MYEVWAWQAPSKALFPIFRNDESRVCRDWVLEWREWLLERGRIHVAGIFYGEQGC